MEHNEYNVIYSSKVTWSLCYWWYWYNYHPDHFSCLVKDHSWSPSIVRYALFSQFSINMKHSIQQWGIFSALENIKMLQNLEILVSYKWQWKEQGDLQDRWAHLFCLISHYRQLRWGGLQPKPYVVPLACITVHLLVLMSHSLFH